MALPLTLGVAAVQESVLVTGASPIVDAKAMGTATNFTQDELSTRAELARPVGAAAHGARRDASTASTSRATKPASRPAFVSKGGRQGDAVWTMDGVPITDMATAGASPTYFDYDAFDEIQISTGGNDIKQATGGVGLNFVVKRGTNQLRGTARGYFTGDASKRPTCPTSWWRAASRRKPPITTSRSRKWASTSAARS